MHDLEMVLRHVVCNRVQAGHDSVKPVLKPLTTTSVLEYCRLVEISSDLC